MNQLHAHYSNRMEMLYQLLKERLFTDTHPLTKRIVIVPSPAMKSWLTLHMARDPDLGVAAGIDIGFVEPMLQKLVQEQKVEDASAVKNQCIPTPLELALAIETVIHALVREPRTEHSDWQPLLQYLCVESTGTKKLSKKLSRRIFSLASTLAQYFTEYGVYGEKMIAEWPLDTDSRWQKLLWDKIEKIFSVWNYPVRQLASSLLKTDLNLEAAAEDDLHIHVFGLSFLPSLYHRFLHKISRHYPVHYYVFSPCQKFWGDLVSDREGAKLKKYWERRGVTSSSQEALDEYLRDNNPLLANYGRLGRETGLQIDHGDPYITEAYVLPESVGKQASYDALMTDDIILQKSDKHMTLLEVVQSDIVLLRNPGQSEKIELSSYDGTIQIHAAPKKVREVQAIYDTLVAIIDQHKDDPSPILPGDIFVMAQNISDYVPFIRSIFEASESQLAIQLLDYKIPVQYPLIRGYLHLLKLATGRWEASEILQLFEYEAFRNRFRLSIDDIVTMKQWIKNTAIYWGGDHAHRTEMMERDYSSVTESEVSEGTWENGFSRLLEGLVMASGSDGEEFANVDSIDASQGPLLGKMIEIIRSLQVDLKPLTHVTLSLTEWTANLKCLVETYFSPITENGPDEGFKILSGYLDIFASASVRLRQETFLFDSIYRHLEDHLQKETTIYRETSLQSVRFSSLLPMRAVPARVVVLMGMGEGAFPRTSQTSAMNLLLNNPQADYFPEAVDFDRYLFLEALLSARDHFVMSYVSQEPGDTKEVLPSILVNELCNYIDKAAIFTDSSEMPSTACCFRHPLDSFHYSYFDGHSPSKAYFKSRYLAALSHYHPEKNEEHSFMTHFPPCVDKEGPVPTESEIHVDLKDLLAMAKNPLKSYLNKTLGIYLKRESDRKIKDTEDLFLSDLHAAIMLRESLSKSENAAQTSIERRLPQGSFKPVGRDRLARERESLVENLKHCGVDKSELFSMEFNDRYPVPEFINNCWRLPPLVIDRAEWGKVKIVGTIETVSPQGMMIFAEDNLKKAVAQWPAVLVFTCLVGRYNLPIPPQLIFLKGDRPMSRKLDFEHPEALLGRYLDYYVSSMGSPSPLMSDWVASILSGDIGKIRGEFEKDSENEYRQQFDEYKKWLERTAPGILPEPIAHWQPVAQHLFHEMASKWYPNRKKHSV
ncbi:MAG: exodeoxyribonuclease V subunit gamma [Parachlamydiaceae bacterium]